MKKILPILLLFSVSCYGQSGWVSFNPDSSAVVFDDMTPDNYSKNFYKLVYTRPGSTARRVLHHGKLDYVKTWMASGVNYFIKTYVNGEQVIAKDYKAYDATPISEIFPVTVPEGDTIHCTKIEYTTFDSTIKTKTLSYLITRIVDGEIVYTGSDGIIYDVYRVYKDTWFNVISSKWFKL